MRDLIEHFMRREVDMKLDQGRFICPWALCRRVQERALLLLEVEIAEEDNEGSNRAFYETGG